VLSIATPSSRVRRSRTGAGLRTGRITDSTVGGESDTDCLSERMLESAAKKNSAALRVEGPRSLHLIQGEMARSISAKIPLVIIPFGHVQHLWKCAEGGLPD